MKKSLAVGENEACLGKAPDTPPSVSICFQNDRAPGCCPLETPWGGTLVGGVMKAYILIWDTLASTVHAMVISFRNRPVNSVSVSATIVFDRSLCLFGKYFVMSEEKRREYYNNLNARGPLPWYDPGDDSRNTSDKCVVHFVYFCCSILYFKVNIFCQV